MLPQVVQGVEYGVILALAIVFVLYVIAKVCYQFDVLLWYTGRETAVDYGETIPLVIQDIDRTSFGFRLFRSFLRLVLGRHSLETYWKSVDDVLTKWKVASSLETEMKKYNVKALATSTRRAEKVAAFLLTAELQDLSVSNLVSLALALEPYSSSRRVSECLSRILCASRGSKSLQFRLAFDALSSLFTLVYTRIDSQFQNDITIHIAQQVEQMAKKPVQIVSDIDDTLYSVLYDKRFPPFTVYPGLRRFYIELAAVSGLSTNKLVFLTARPEMFRDRTLKHLRQCGVADATVLMGSFRTLFGARRMAQQKLENFLQYQKLFPEYRFVFIGDNGQADIDLGKLLLEKRIASQVWIHDIIRNKAEKPYRLKECQELGIELFTSYIGATYCAIRAGILPIEALSRVIEATSVDLSYISFLSVDQELRCRSELMIAVNTVLEQLQQASIIPNPFT